MATIASYTDKQTFESTDIAIAESKTVRFMTYGAMGPDGSIRLLVKGVDGAFHDFRSLTASDHAHIAVSVSVLAGDLLRVRFSDCQSAGAEISE